MMRGTNNLLKLSLLNLIMMVMFYLQHLLKKGVFLIELLTLDVSIIYVIIGIGFQHMIQLTLVLFTWVPMPNVMSLELAQLKSRPMNWHN